MNELSNVKEDDLRISVLDTDTNRRSLCKQNDRG